MSNKELAGIMFPNVKHDIAYYEELYPERDLPEGAVVSRYAPSPTGFVHIGNMLACFIENKVPKQTGGVFYLRIEDTDQKREVEHGITNIIDAMKVIGLDYNEGVMSETEQKGNYGPYIQSQRLEIYDSFAKYMIENDLAYPCFCTAEEIGEIRKIQEINKERIGYYGSYAKCRFLTNEERAEKIKAGVPYTIRLKSQGNFNNKIKFHDLVKGDIEFPENDIDYVLVKSDGIPVYHFAHLVDDHLMRTTHVLRGEDWLPSVPIHYELFKMFGFKLPKYAHLGLIMIIDKDGTKRKISKRKDLDYAVKHFHEIGMPKETMQDYLMTIANSNYEGWKDSNLDKTLDDFKFEFSKIGGSPLFDMEKLISLSKTYISKLTASEVYDRTLAWAKQYDLDFANIIEKHKDYTTAILNIEREQKKPRKDYESFGSIKKYIWYMFDEYFKGELNYDFQNITDKNEIKKILSTYMEKYDENDDKETWFNKIKQLTEELGYCADMKMYKENPDAYPGNVADVSTVIRVALTTSSQTPDLYELLKLVGKDRIKDRFSKFM